MEEEEMPKFTEEESAQLRNQLLAYKYLSSGQQIPEGLLSSIGKLTKEEYEQDSKRLENDIDFVFRLF